MTKPLYKVLSAELWRAAESEGEFRGAGIDLQDGFIHLSSADQVVETVLLHFAGQTEQRTRVTHFQHASFDQLRGLRPQLQQSQQVGHRRPGTPNGFGRRLMCHLELAYQATQRAGLFQGIEVFPLDVLD